LLNELQKIPSSRFQSLSREDIDRLFGPPSQYLGYKICGTFEYTRAQPWNFAGKLDSDGVRVPFHPQPYGDIYPATDANETYQHRTCSDDQCSKLKLIVFRPQILYLFFLILTLLAKIVKIP